MTVMASPAAPKPSSLGSEKKRFFVGNLFPDANQSDLEKLFSKFGSVVDVEIKNKKDPDGNVLTTFAFVNCSGIAESRVQQCIRECNGLKWKGKVVKVQVAQETFLQRLQKEWKAKQEATSSNFDTQPDPSYNPLELFKKKKEEDDKNPITKKHNVVRKYMDDSDDEPDSKAAAKTVPYAKVSKKDKKKKKAKEKQDDVQFSSENLAKPNSFHKPGERRFGDLPTAAEIARMKAKEERARIQVNEHEDSLKKQREIAADIAKKIGLGSSAAINKQDIFDDEDDFDVDEEEVDMSRPEDGRVQEGVVHFSDDEHMNNGYARGKYRKAVPKPRQKRGYHSSSDDDSDADEAQNTVPLIPQAKKAKASLESKKSDSPSKATTSSKKAEPPKKPPPPKEKQRYYSSSSEDDEDNTPAQKSASNQKFLSNLESFNSGFWMDSDKEEGGESGEEEDDDDRRLGESRSDYQSRKAKESKQFETEENLSTTEIKSAGEAIALSSKNQAAQSDTNAKRLQALKKRQEELNKSKLVIKTSLSHVDSTKNKKIVFDTESKNEGDLLRKEASAKPKAQLFDGGDSSDEESQADDFKIRSQFHGESGEKNLSLQARFASDSRFKIDDRFKDGAGKKDSDSDGESSDEDDGADDERQRNLDILNGIIKPKGDDSNSEGVKKKAGAFFKDNSKMRFDPTRDDHKQFEVSKNQTRKTLLPESDEEDITADEVVKETPMPEVGKERSFWMKQEVFAKKDEKKEKEDAKGFSFGFGVGSNEASGSGFSLLSKFGRNQDEYAAENIQKKSKRNEWLEKNPFKYDSSDSEDDDGDSESKSKKSKAPVMPVDPKLEEFSRNLSEKSKSAEARILMSEPFFFSALDDKRLQEAKDFLENRSETLDEIRTKFEDQRPVLSSIMKKKLRTKAKKMEKTSFGTKSGRISKRRKVWGRGKK